MKTIVFSKGDLIKIAENGDHEAFKRMFHYFYARLLSVARHYVHSHELAEEVVNDVFVKIWNKRKKLVQIKKLEKYLYVLVKNHALNQIREASGHRVMSIDKTVLEITVSSVNPEEQFLSKEMLEVFQRSVDALPPKCGLVFRMVKDDQLTYKEVASILNISVKMVEKHVGLGLKRLRKDLDNYVDGASNLKSHMHKGLLLAAILLLT
ncbi:RNA polymerase sigma-70 factor [Fulvivirgaceae bacterium BMA12]|uniref:RNA polymerase sigma-70 factor n=1 Tax=Agaribacillus aureus TaxID=3051825 RepID=A0ABT8LF68_9BACT|nr:RNA polymerase sigma-70 factor [Fulvivirgaceae bacterium BMA12]